MKIKSSFWPLFLITGILITVHGVPFAQVSTPVTQQMQMLSLIRSAGKIRVGMNPGYKPFEYKNEKGEIIGFDVDLARELASALGVTLEIKEYEKYEDLIPALGGDIDIIISGMTRTLERALRVNFTDPYFQTGQAVITNEKNAGITSWKQLNIPGKKIAVVEGTTGQELGEKKFDRAKVIRATNESDAVQMLAKGTVDAFLHDRPFIQSLGLSHPKWNVLEEQLSYEFYSFAIPKGDFDFLLWLNYFISELKISGKYDEIYNRWFSGIAGSPAR